MSEGSYNNVSVMEDLDPEPERSGGLLHARELVLGLALLVGVLGWAGWQMWRDESNRTNYAQAQQAVAARRWGDALSHFEAAGGYKDADARAADARKQVWQRDSQYASASVGWSEGALIAAHAVQTIQPGYKDVDELAAKAEKQVYSDALNGVVALRTEAKPPGLYYRDETGWVWLQGSDRWSQVRSMGTPSRIVYDVPGSGWQPPVKATPTPSGYNSEPGSPDLVGRGLSVMQIESVYLRYSFLPLSLDPAQYNSYICGEAGVWAVRNEGILGSIRKPSLPLGPFVYEAFGSPITSTVSFIGTQSGVVDLGRNGNSILVAGYGQPIGGRAISVLYIAEPDGRNLHVLYSLPGKGGFDSAHLSPDGRFALLVTYEPVEGAQKQGAEKLKALLLDVDGNTPPRVLAETVKSVAEDMSGTRYMELTIAATFLNTGPLWNKILLAWVGPDASDQVNLRLVDPGSPAVPLLTTSTPGDITTELIGTEDANSGLLLMAISFLDTVSTEKPSTQTLLHIELETGSLGRATARQYTIPFGMMPVFLDARIQKSNLIYGGLHTTEDKVGFSVATMPLSEIGKPGAKESTLYDVTLPRDGAGPLPSRRYHLGTDSLAYIDRGELIVHSYESGINTTLEGGVTDLFEPDTYLGTTGTDKV